MTDEDNKKLELLNAEVENAIKNRREWLDAKMSEYAEVNVGEELYNLNTGICVGVVTRHYRFWESRDDGVRDTSLDINYEYRCRDGYIDNSSRQSGVALGSKKQAFARMEYKTNSLRQGA